MNFALKLTDFFIENDVLYSARRLHRGRQANQRFRRRVVCFCITKDEFCITNDGFCIKHDEFCIKHDELCIRNDEFRIINDEFCISEMRVDLYRAVQSFADTAEGNALGGEKVRFRK